MKKLLTVFSISTLFLLSCKSDSTSGGNNNPSGSNVMTVTIDGTASTFTAGGARAVSGGSTVITISASDAAGRIVGIGMTNITTAGTYNIGYSSTGDTSIVLTYIYGSGSDASNYTSSVDPGVSSGTIAITTLTATSFKATFSGTLTKLAGPGANTLVFTNGTVTAPIL